MKVNKREKLRGCTKGLLIQLHLRVIGPDASLNVPVTDPSLDDVISQIIWLLQIQLWSDPTCFFCIVVYLNSHLHLIGILLVVGVQIMFCFSDSHSSISKLIKDMLLK